MMSCVLGRVKKDRHSPNHSLDSPGTDMTLTVCEVPPLLVAVTFTV